MEIAAKEADRVCIVSSVVHAFWCDDCITAHNIIRVNKKHRVLVLLKDWCIKITTSRKC